MAESGDSRIQQAAPRNGSTVRDWLLKIAASLVVLLLVGAYTLAWAHETRITVMETRDEGIREDIAEMKADLKTLLRRRQ